MKHFSIKRVPGGYLMPPVGSIAYIEARAFRLKVVFDWRSSRAFMGRFGGGWNWKIGFESGGSTVIVSLLVADLIFSIVPADELPKLRSLEKAGRAS